MKFIYALYVIIRISVIDRKTVCASKIIFDICVIMLKECFLNHPYKRTNVENV